MIGNTPSSRDRSDSGLSDEAIERLVHLRSGRATEADRAAFAAWRRQSPAHDAAAREAESLWHDLAETPTAAAHSEAWARQETDGPPGGFPHGPSERYRARLARRAVLTGGLAASAAAIVVGSGAIGPVSGVFADYATRVGARREVALPDGSTAVLNSATALSLAYSPEERRLVLHAGEALFDVAADAARPFVVTAASGEIRALGTVFSVRHESDAIRVMVSEGTVEVRSEGGRGDPRQVAARQQTTFDARGFDAQGVAAPTSLDVAAATAWVRGKLIFNKRPLAEVVAELERHQAGRIVILDKKLESLEVSGVFDLGDPDDGPSAALGTLERILRVRVVRLPLLTLIR